MWPGPPVRITIYLSYSWRCEGAPVGRAIFRSLTFGGAVQAPLRGAPFSETCFLWRCGARKFQKLAFCGAVQAPLRGAPFSELQFSCMTLCRTCFYTFSHDFQRFSTISKLCSPVQHACSASQTSEKTGSGFSGHMTDQKHHRVC